MNSGRDLSGDAEDEALGCWAGGPWLALLYAELWGFNSSSFPLSELPLWGRVLPHHTHGAPSV